MKKLITVAVCAAVVFSAASLTAAAEQDLRGVKFPFEVEAPSNLSVQGLEGSDSATTMEAAWSMNNSMSKWLSEMADPETHDAALEKLSKENGLDELYVTTQIDWAIDDPVDGWHYTEYWDGVEYTTEDGGKQWTGYGNDKDGHLRTGEWDILETLVYAQTVNDAWILRGNRINNNPEWTEEERATTNEWFYGNEYIPGLKNQLKEDQYTLVEVDPERHDQELRIDWTQHTVYIRARWAFDVIKGDERFPVFSDWSETASYGKEAEAYQPLTKESLAPPVISQLRYYENEFNGYPQIAVTLTVPDELSKALTDVTSRGGDIWIEWEARVPEGSWCGLQGGGTVTAGENIIALQNLAEQIIRENSENGISTPEIVIAKDAPLELRARYWCNQYASRNGEYIGEFFTDYSEVLTFGAQEMSHTETSAPAESSVPEESVKPTESSAAETSVKPADNTSSEISKVSENKGSFPLWIIIVIILVVIIIVVIIILIVMKKKKDEENSQNGSRPHNP